MHIKHKIRLKTWVYRKRTVPKDGKKEMQSVPKLKTLS